MAKAAGEDLIYEFGPFRLDSVERLLLRDGLVVPLTPKAFDLLVYLVQRHGRLAEKQALLSALWPDTIVEEGNLASNVAALRKALDDGSSDSMIQTVPTKGYRFVAPVTEVVGAASPGAAASELDDRPAASTRWWRPAASVAGRTIAGRPLLWAGGAVMLVLLVLAVLLKIPTEPAPVARTVPLTSYPGLESAASFSPDGSRVAFQSSPPGSGPPGTGESHIFVKLIGDDPPQRLTDGPNADVFPAWSPDGRSIAFTRLDDERSGIFTIPVLGGSPRKIDTVQQHSWGPCMTQPRWSPDGRQLVFASRHDKDCRLEVLSLDTFDRRVLTSAKFPAWEASPAFSPDGRTVAFVHKQQYFQGDLYVVPASGGPAKRITYHDANMLGQVAWTPDGRFIVFASDRGGSTALWRVPSAGGVPERLAVEGESVIDPAFDSTGRRLAYTRFQRDTQIYELDLRERSGALHVVAPSTSVEAAPQYSPDGREVAFESARGQGGFATDIWVAEASGADPVRLTFFDRVGSGTPRWSPDGKWIAFHSAVNGNFDIFTVRPMGGSATRLTSDAASDRVPSWSVDGRWIYFTSDRSGAAQVWKMPASGGPPIQITKQGGFGGFESRDGRYFYYSKSEEGSGVWRVPTGGGLEESVLSDLPQEGYAGCWALVDDGLYFANQDSQHPPSIEFFSFATRQPTEVATLPNRVAEFGMNLTVSPDRHQLLVVLVSLSSDIALVEGFR